MGPTNQEQNIVVQITKEFNQIKAPASKFVELIKTICSLFAKEKIKNTRYEISLVIVDDTKIRKLNRRFLNRSSITDCLSFDLSDDKKLSTTGNENTKTYELIVNGEMAARQAKLLGHSGEAEPMGSPMRIDSNGTTG